MNSERPRTAESNHPPIGYMHQCMQLACLMGDVKEVERVAAIEGYNLEHLILGKRPMHLAAVANQPDVIRASQSRRETERLGRHVQSQ